MRERLVHVRRRQQRDDRTEDLVAGDGIVRASRPPERWAGCRHPRRARPAAATSRARRLGCLPQSRDAVAAARSMTGPTTVAGSIGSPDARLPPQDLQECVAERLMAASTAMTRGSRCTSGRPKGHRTAHDHLRRTCHVRVWCHDDGVLAAHLQLRLDVRATRPAPGAAGPTASEPVKLRRPRRR